MLDCPKFISLLASLEPFGGGNKGGLSPLLDIGIGGIIPGGACVNGEPIPSSWFDMRAPGRFGGGTPIGTLGMRPGGRLMWAPIGPRRRVLSENGDTKGIAIGGGGRRPLVCNGGG